MKRFRHYTQRLPSFSCKAVLDSADTKRIGNAMLRLGYQAQVQGTRKCSHEQDTIGGQVGKFMLLGAENGLFCFVCFDLYSL